MSHQAQSHASHGSARTGVAPSPSGKLEKSAVDAHVPLDLRANEEEVDAVQSYYGESIAPPAHPTPPSHASGVSHSNEHVPLKEREELAKLAFRAWFRIKVGNKEIKDRWWALYYRKLHPKYHLRDNHLGRKINMWIEEEIDRLRDPDPNKLPLAPLMQPARSGRKPKSAALALSDGTGVSDASSNTTASGKKRKANSAKEGTQPAYINVELQQPPKGLTGELVDWLKPLSLCLRDEQTALDWSKEQLEEDVAWFRDNREQIMDQIPCLAARPRMSVTHSPPHGSHGSGAMKKHKTEMEAEGVTVESDQEWLRCDVLKAADANEIIVRVDLPGCAPAHDFELQTGSEPPNAATGAPGGHKLIVKGERKPDPAATTGAAAYVHQTRHVGRFQLVVGLPVTADIAKTEQTFACGVLTVKVPLATAWRTLDVLAVGQ